MLFKQPLGIKLTNCRVALLLFNFDSYFSRNIFSFPPFFSTPFLLFFLFYLVSCRFTQLKQPRKVFYKKAVFKISQNS